MFRSNKKIETFLLNLGQEVLAESLFSKYHSNCELSENLTPVKYNEVQYIRTEWNKVIYAIILGLPPFSVGLQIIGKSESYRQIYVYF